MNVRLLITIAHKLAVIQLDHTPVLVEQDIKIMDMETVLVRAYITYFVLWKPCTILSVYCNNQNAVYLELNFSKHIIRRLCNMPSYPQSNYCYFIISRKFLLGANFRLFCWPKILMNFKTMKI